MKTLIFTVAMLLLTVASNAQRITLAALIKYYNSPIPEISDALLVKDFTYAGKEDESSSSIHTTTYLWGYKYNMDENRAEEWVTKFTSYDLDEENQKGEYRGTTVTYQTPVPQTYLAIKKELSTLGFKLSKRSEYEGVLEADYINAKYLVTLFSAPNNVWEIAVTLKPKPKITN